MKINELYAPQTVGPQTVGPHQKVEKHKTAMHINEELLNIIRKLEVSKIKTIVESDGCVHKVEQKHTKR